MPHNKAAWLKDAKSPLTIDDAPEPRPGLGEVVVKNHAVAVNPVDWKIQTYDIFVPSYPTILGVDFAGIVETVGEGATRFVKGQRVIGQGSTAVTGNPANAAYHLYSSTFEILVAPIPDSLSYEDAVVLPLALSTASVGLYAKSHQALPFPTLSPKESGKTVLIWGGASSVGATAVQLAAASGVKVVTTASPKNFELVQSLGAAAVLDYTSPSVVDDVVSALRQAAGTFVGAYDAIATTETLELIGKIAEKAGAAPVLVASVAPADNNIQGVDLRPCKSVCPDDRVDNKDVGEAVWYNFVPAALESGKLRCVPSPVVIGEGLGQIQNALDKLKAGVSAQKIVVKL